MNRRWRRGILNVVCHFHSAFGWIYTSHLTRTLSSLRVNDSKNREKFLKMRILCCWFMTQLQYKHSSGCMFAVCTFNSDSTAAWWYFFSSSLFLNLCSTCGIEFHDADAPIWLSFRVALIIHNMAFHSFQWRGESELSLERNVILCSFVSLRWMIQTSVCTV